MKLGEMAGVTGIKTQDTSSETPDFRTLISQMDNSSQFMDSTLPKITVGHLLLWPWEDRSSMGSLLLR